MRAILRLTFIVFTTISLSYAQPSQNKKMDTLIVQIKVEIKQNDTTGRSAKSYDFVKKSDFFDISVRPLLNCHFYLIHYNKKEASVIKKDFLSKEKIYNYPEDESYYQIDGTQEKENLVLVLSKKQDKYLEGYNEKASDTQKLEQYLANIEKKSRIEFDEQAFTNPGIKGSIRGIISKLAGYIPYIGDGTIVKKFIFNVSN